MRKIAVIFPIILMLGSSWASGSPTTSKLKEWAGKAETATSHAWQSTKSGTKKLWDKMHSKKKSDS